MTLHVDEGLETLSLSDLNGRLAPDAQRVLHGIAKRVVAGQAKHGHLDIATDKRDWRKETRAEMEDAIVYRTIAEIAGEMAELLERLAVAERNHDIMLETLTHAQARCTALLEENRALKRAQK